MILQRQTARVLCGAVLIAPLLLWNAPALPQSALDGPPTAGRDAERRDAPPPRSVRATLDGQLAREAKAKRIGAQLINAFPLSVWHNGLQGAVNRDGTYAVPPIYKDLGLFSEGRAAMRLP